MKIVDFDKKHKALSFYYFVVRLQRTWPSAVSHPQGREVFAAHLALYFFFSPHLSLFLPLFLSWFHRFTRKDFRVGWEPARAFFIPRAVGAELAPTAHLRLSLSRFLQHSTQLFIYLYKHIVAPAWSSPWIPLPVGQRSREIGFPRPLCYGQPIDRYFEFQ